MSYLKKILGELAMVLDQIEAELEKRKLENEGEYHIRGKGLRLPASPAHSAILQALSPGDPRALPVFRVRSWGVRPT